MVDEKKLLPAQYHLEIYENSFTNDPVISLKSISPFPPITVGDYVHEYDHAWHSQPQRGTTGLQVKEIEHLLWEIKGSHIGYKMMVRVEIVPREL